MIELSFRNRISCIKDPRKPAFADRTVKVDDDTLTGEVLLDETLRYLKSDADSVANWIDLLSGKLNYCSVYLGPNHFRRNLESL